MQNCAYDAACAVLPTCRVQKLISCCDMALAACGLMTTAGSVSRLSMQLTVRCAECRSDTLRAGLSVFVIGVVGNGITASWRSLLLLLPRKNGQEWTIPDCRNTPSRTNLGEEGIADAPGNDGNASMPEQVKRSNPRRMIIIIIITLSFCFVGRVAQSV